MWLRVSCCHTLTGYHLEVSLCIACACTCVMHVCMRLCMCVFVSSVHVCVYITYIHYTTGQYTTGRGSSGVGLTAAVMKDPLTSEMTLGKSPLHKDKAAFSYPILRAYVLYAT